MRINKFLAQATGISRRAADMAIQQGTVLVNSKLAAPGQEIGDADTVHFGDTVLTVSDLPAQTQTIVLHKPVGYVVSRNGQGSRTIYDLLPLRYRTLKPVGRLDKDSSGLLVLTSDGELANQLTHPRYGKQKIYEVHLDRSLEPLHRQMIQDFGVQLDDGPSTLLLERVQENDDRQWIVRMKEGRNRQIRRTFAALGYTVTGLHRTHFGNYNLGELQPGKLQEVA